MSLAIDLEFTYGENFEEEFILYDDSRFELWRGEWQEWRVYEKGEGVVWRNRAYVALMTTEHAEPGGPGMEQFWAPMKEANLAGATVTFTVEGVITEKPVTVVGGKVTIVALPAEFAAAPSSAHHYVKISSAGKTNFPITGTAVFRKP